MMSVVDGIKVTNGADSILEQNSKTTRDPFPQINKPKNHVSWYLHANLASTNFVQYLDANTKKHDFLACLFEEKDLLLSLSFVQVLMFIYYPGSMVCII
jgi:hypothetical protein